MLARSSSSPATVTCRWIEGHFCSSAAPDDFETSKSRFSEYMSGDGCAREWDIKAQFLFLSDNLELAVYLLDFVKPANVAVSLGIHYRLYLIFLDDKTPFVFY